MAGLTPKAPSPTNILVRTASRLLEISFDNERVFELPFELMRVYSPSAEVRGHGPGQETLQTGKRNVGISSLEPVGNYAIQPHFDDGHSTGIFSWEYLYWLGDEQESLWEDYLAKIEQAGASRDADAPASGDPAQDESPMDAKSVSRPR